MATQRRSAQGQKTNHTPGLPITQPTPQQIQAQAQAQAAQMQQAQAAQIQQAQAQAQMQQAQMQQAQANQMQQAQAAHMQQAQMQAIHAQLQNAVQAQQQAQGITAEDMSQLGNTYMVTHAEHQALKEQCKPLKKQETEFEKKIVNFMLRLRRAYVPARLPNPKGVPETKFLCLEIRTTEGALKKEKLHDFFKDLSKKLTQRTVEMKSPEALSQQYMSEEFGKYRQANITVDVKLALRSKQPTADFLELVTPLLTCPLENVGKNANEWRQQAFPQPRVAEIQALMSKQHQAQLEQRTRIMDEIFQS